MRDLFCGLRKAVTDSLHSFQVLLTIRWPSLYRGLLQWISPERLIYLPVQVFLLAPKTAKTTPGSVR